MKTTESPVPYGTPHKQGLSLDFTSDLGQIIDLPAESLTKAARNVAARAVGVDDARLLLDVLGLLPAPTTPEAAQ